MSSIFTIFWLVFTLGTTAIAVGYKHYYLVLAPIASAFALIVSFVPIMSDPFMNLAIQFAVGLVIYIALLLPYALASKFRTNKIRKGKTNITALIGQRCLVVEDISNINVKGLVNLKGSIWSARSSDPNDYIEQGTIVVVETVEGVKLVCKREK